ncbi:MAG: DUF6378 domain-containing protein [Hyphomicrobiales bacterium]
MKVTDMAKNDVASKTLKTALDLVTGPRQEQHGDKMLDFTNIGLLWQAYLFNRDLTVEPIKPSDVGNMMELLKVARRKTGSHNPDDYVDGAGYAACAAECREQEVAEENRVGRGFSSTAAAAVEDPVANLRAVAAAVEDKNKK